jgi:hypothetical protein
MSSPEVRDWNRSRAEDKIVLERCRLALEFRSVPLSDSTVSVNGVTLARQLRQELVCAREQRNSPS